MEDIGRLATWDPCVASPIRGVAFFDGIFLKCDALTDPRWDRVLAILEEEQVAVSRLMRRLLRPGMRVLDLGTGCGVFAIVAAKADCQVVALDISERACRITMENAKANQIRVKEIRVNGEMAGVSTQPADWCIPLRNGEMLILNADYEKIPAPISEEDKFDVIILSPPYTPTHPALDRQVALHASAGPFGQHIFHRHIRWTPNYLKQAGVCLGNQMSLSYPKQGEYTFSLAADVENAFGNKGELDLVPLLADRIPVCLFLENQYQDLARSLNKSDDDETAKGAHSESAESSDKEEMEKFLDNYFKKEPENRTADFSLFFFAYTKTQAAMTAPKLHSYLINGQPPSWKWKDRVRAHRHFVNHTEPQDSCSILRLFVPSAAGFVPESRTKSTNQDHPDEPIQCDVTRIQVLKEVNRYVKRESLDELFSVIFVDGAPLNGGDLSLLREECAVWLNGCWDRNELQADLKSIPLQLLKAWQRTTMQLWDARMGPIAHPAFVGMQRRGSTIPNPRWPDKQVSRLPETRPDSALNRYVNQYRKNLQKRQITEDAIDASADFGHRYAMCKSKFDRLGADAVKRFSDVLDKRIVELRADGEFSALTNEDLEHLDLQACHQAMHAMIHERFRESLGEGRTLPHKWTSTLIGVPLGTLFMGHDRSAGFPTHYKGGLWLLLVPKADKWEDRHERAAWDLVKVLWFLLMGTYGAQAEAAREKKGQRMGRIALGHMAPFAISSSIEDLLRLFDSIDLHRAELPAEIAESQFPIELYSTAVNAALEHRGRDLESFIKAIPRFPNAMEKRIARDGLGTEDVKYLYQRIARPLAELRLAASGIYEAAEVNLQVDGGFLQLAGHNSDVRELAVFLTALITLLKEAIEHTARLLTEGSSQRTENQRSNLAVLVRLIPGPGPRIGVEISNPCFRETALLDYAGGCQQIEMEVLQKHLRQWKIVELPEIINNRWIRRIESVQR